MSAEAMRRYRDSHPDYDRDKILAHAAVGKAVKSGRLTRRNCERCGSSDVHAHHYMGYGREYRLIVRWLCPDHHREAHSQGR